MCSHLHSWLGKHGKANEFTELGFVLKIGSAEGRRLEMRLRAPLKVFCTFMIREEAELLVWREICACVMYSALNMSFASSMIAPGDNSWKSSWEQWPHTCELGSVSAKKNMKNRTYNLHKSIPGA
jgi:hypothetical protein